MPIQVLLYTKQGCGLCTETKMHLHQLASQYPHQLKEVDITSDPYIHRQYHLVIPVVLIGQQELQAPISIQQLETALQQVTAVD
jgi:glutaredoxin